MTTNAPDQAAIEKSIRTYLDRYGRADAAAATVLCDEHPADAVAFTLIDADVKATDVTYGWLRESSERFAGGLEALGIKPGDRVATIMGKSPDFLAAVLGIWRLGAVHVPLFTAFAPAAITVRLESSGAVAVIADGDQRPKLEPGADMPADPPWRIITSGDLFPGDISFKELMGAAPIKQAAALGGEGTLVEIYTSGTTGMPKGVVLPLKALAAIHTYVEYGLDVRDDDVFWCAADPGWALGLYIGVLGAMASRRRSVMIQPGFTPDLAWRVLSEHGVTNFLAAPTIYRALRGAEASARPVKLRCASSAGEPLTPDVNQWAGDALGVEVHDQYGQSEHGMLVNNHHHPAVKRPIKPGSMGTPMPGWRVEVLENESDEIAAPNTVGRVALSVHDSPLWFFSGYKGNEEATKARFTPDGAWYLTGDAGSLDEDGYITFYSRDDDVIIMAGYRIGPAEVESVLAGHPAVAECAVIAAPDQVRGEVIEAFVVLRDGSSGSPDLTKELQQLVKARYAAHAYPRVVHFVDALPKTPSGKIQRFVLRDRRRAEVAAAAD